MSRKYSLAHLTVLQVPPPEMIYIASMAGYDYVSLRTIYMGLPGEPNYELAKNKTMLQQTKRALTETGLSLLDIELARVFDGMDSKAYEPAMAVAAELGGRHVLSSIWTENREYYLEKFAEICDLAKDYGLTVDLEFVPIAGIRDLKGTINVLRTVNRDNAGLLIDTHHFQRSGDNPEDLKELPRSWFNFAHLCDAPGEIPDNREEMTRILREARDYVGEGDIDIAGIVQAMPRNLNFSIELPNLEKVREIGYAEHARRCLVSAKAYMDHYLPL
ncbi:MAG: AP endonuclease [delta proteobacterium ML8_F1]|nr:MAG: AP endonuclease [delta proteobacterium ML8_F1]